DPDRRAPHRARAGPGHRGAVHRRAAAGGVVRDLPRPRLRGGAGGASRWVMTMPTPATVPPSSCSGDTGSPTATANASPTTGTTLVNGPAADASSRLTPTFHSSIASPEPNTPM